MPAQLELSLLPTNENLPLIHLRRSIVSVIRDEQEIFAGQIVGAKTDMDGTVTLSGVSRLSYLMDSVQPEIEYSGSAQNFFSLLLTNHNGQVGAAKQFARGAVTRHGLGSSLDVKVSAGQTTWDVISSVVDEHGGHLYVTESGTLQLNWTDGGEVFSPVSCQYGVNILDISVELNTDDLLTSVTAEGKDGATGEASDSVAAAIYGEIAGYVKCDAETSEGAQAYAESYLAEHAEPLHTVAVKAIGGSSSLWCPWNVGDLVSVKSNFHSVDAWIICAEKEIDLSGGSPDVVSLGKIPQRLTDSGKRTDRINAWLSVMQNMEKPRVYAVDSSGKYAISGGARAVAKRS